MKKHIRKSNKVLLIGYICAVIIILFSVISFKKTLDYYYPVSQIQSSAEVVTTS